MHCCYSPVAASDAKKRTSKSVSSLSLPKSKNLEEIQNVTAIGVKTKLKRIETQNNQKLRLEIIELKLKNEFKTNLERI